VTKIIQNYQRGTIYSNTIEVPPVSAPSLVATLRKQCTPSEGLANAHSMTTVGLLVTMQISHTFDLRYYCV